MHIKKSSPRKSEEALINNGRISPPRTLLDGQTDHFQPDHCYNGPCRGYGSLSEFQLNSAGPEMTIEGIRAAQSITTGKKKPPGAVEYASPPMPPLKSHRDVSGLPRAAYKYSSQKTDFTKPCVCPCVTGDDCWGKTSLSLRLRRSCLGGSICLRKLRQVGPEL